MAHHAILSVPSINNNEEHVMDELFLEQIQQLDEIQSLLSTFETSLEKKDNEYSSQIEQETNEYKLWESMLESEINK